MTLNTNTTAQTLTEQMNAARTIGELAAALYRGMVSDTRNDGSTFYKFDEAIAPLSGGWVSELSHAAHGDMLPDDTRYSLIHDALSVIATNWEDGSEASDLADYIEADIMNADLLEWVSSDLTRASYVDDAVEEYGYPGDFYKALQYGQKAEADEVFYSVFQSLENRAEEIADDDTDEEE